MPLILLFFAGLGYFYLAAKKHAPTPAKTSAQPISYQAKQNYLQGDQGSTPGYASRGEGSNIILQKQDSLLTDRVSADLADRSAKTFDPQWRMRWLNAWYRSSLQQDINAGRAPQGPVNIDRTVEEVNADSGPASGFTRTQFTYQHRYTRSRGRAGYGPNATRPLDQMDPADQTSMQTAQRGNGWKSIIYPRDLDGIPRVDLERDYWDANGSAHNPGYTRQDGPAKLGGIPLFEQIIRFFTGATTTGTALPSRSNMNDDSIN